MVSVQKNIYKVTGRGRVCLCDFLSSNSISLASARCAHAHTIIDLGDALSIRERDRTPALRKRRKETESDQCANTRARRPAFEGGAHAAARTLTTRRLPTASMLTFSESSAQLLAGPPFAAGAAGAAGPRKASQYIQRLARGATISAAATSLDSTGVEGAGCLGSRARMRDASHAYGAAGLCWTSSLSQALRFAWMACSSKYCCSASTLGAPP
mmetsp:Transcript_21004/g.61803  ORF Transcript_21004/g.61803 Transcript_21004/m.61803 type:complete len:213 (-) Transcript_21004:16-654(-)